MTEYVPSEILIKFRETLPSPPPPIDEISSELIGPAPPTDSLCGTLSYFGIPSLEPVFAEAGPYTPAPWPSPADPTAEAEEMTVADSAAADRADLLRWYRVELASEADTAKALEVFGALAEVEFAEPNYEYGLTYEIPTVIEGLPDATTDPGYAEQWHHAAAKIPNAWNYLNQNGVYPGGNRDVVVAVIDTGVDYNHEELVSNMWVNIDEIPNNNIDDDGNGFVDDIHGCNVVSDGRSHSGDPIDLHGHGTHVAGIIAAAAFNGTGGIGAAFNTQIMAIRAAQYSGVLTTQDISEGILYAVDNGAEVINMSFGGYQRSQIVVDALEVALNQAVLVAAAGNDGIDIKDAPHYPSALPWVLGVMASDAPPKQALAWFSNTGYEIQAPGVSIYSTLPNNSYAAWSGTSMATPVVAGIAALMRSYFWQRDIYSSRFIMGSIAASGTAVDAYKALTEPPKPGVSMYDNWIFDDTTIDPGNDADGRIDAGETIHMAIELINRSGSAENVTATLEAQAPSAALPDPYVTITTDTVEFGNIGPFAIADNDLVWNNEGIITGVNNPFVFTVSPDCPNDHVIPFVLTTTFQDGWDENHKEYTRIDRFSFIVQRGKNIPTVISEDTVLTSEEYWIVGGPVLVEPGVTLTIAEGTQVQWGAISSDPYNPGPQTGSILVRGSLVVEGTEDNPVSLFPSYLVSGQRTTITTDGGSATMRYANVRNPNMQSFKLFDHVYFQWDAYTSTINGSLITNCRFDKFLGGGSLSASEISTSLYNAGRLGPGASRLYNNVFLQDNEHNSPLSLTTPTTFDTARLQNFTVAAYRDDESQFSGTTYTVLSVTYTDIALVELVANFLGGHVVSIPNQDELNYVKSFVTSNWPPGKYHTFYIGLSDAGHPGTYTWLDGSPMDYTNWADGYPVELPPGSHVVRISQKESWTTVSTWTNMMPVTEGHNDGQEYILRLPGQWTLEDLNAPELWEEMTEYIRENYVDEWQPVRENAFLSKYWEPSLGRWMRFYAASGADNYSAMYDNYWGTDTTTLIDHAIVDYYDNFTTAHVDYGTLPEHGYETTYPFVESVTINGMPTESVPTLGAGPTTFAVTFNRAMDPDVQPFVTFGPSSPHTDFTVHPIGGNDAGYNDNKIVFTVTLSAPVSRTVTVDYETVDDTAISGVDYEAASGTITFEPGQITQTIEVDIDGDQWEETDKNFWVVLSDPTFVELADDRALGTIVDDDPTLSVGDIVITEGDAASTNAFFTITLSAPCGEEATVVYETEDGTALAGVDYQAVAGTAVFEPGETEQVIAVPVFGDTTGEPDKTFSLVLTHPTRVNIADNRAEAVIEDNDPAILVGDAEIVEGNADTTDVVFTVSLSQAVGQAVTVDYVTASGSAVAGEDFQAVSGTLSFAPNETEQTIHVPVNGDVLGENDENFYVVLSNPTGLAIADDRGKGIILDDDVARLSVDSVTVTEGDSGTVEAVFTVSLSVDLGGTVTVDYATAGGTAASGEDFQAVGGTLSFETSGPLTQTIAVPIVGDTIDEYDETFLLRLSNATGAEIVVAEGIGTIANDDQPAITIDDAEIWEGDEGTSEMVFTIRLSADPAVAVSVDYTTTAEGTALANEDYKPIHSTITWRPGEPLERTIRVPIIGDDADEADETLMVDLSNAHRGAIDDAQAIGTIRDDEPKVSIDDVRIVEGDAGTTQAVFTVQLASPPDRTVVVQYATAASTAQSDTDYLSATGTLTFEPGQPTSQTIAVSIVGDLDSETNETFFVDLTGAIGAYLTAARGTGTIIGDDGPLVSIADAGFVEGDSGTVNHAFTVSISADPPERVIVDYQTADGMAQAGFDYNAVNATLVFDPGQPLQQTILVPILGDTLSETDETFCVYLTNATVVAISDYEAVGTIADDDPLISIDDVTVTEGVTGAVEMVFTVSISMDPPDDVTLDFATAAVTATEGTDYLAASGSLTFSPGGPDQQTITVTALGDVANEIHETFLVELTNLVNANFAKSSGVGTITDDDGAKIVIDDVILTETDTGTTNAVFTVSLTEAAAQTVTVDWSTADGTARAGADYAQASGTLTFEPGQPTSQQITVTVYGDGIDETDETFQVVLSEADGAPILKETGQATIVDNDTATLSIDDVTVIEGYNGWINNRTWQGTFWITPMTGESYHLMRISDAVAADDSWLVSGDDVGRIRFEVQTMGVEAMTLQAGGQEGAIRLTWAQDDFDLLAGYNLYRSSSIDGTYERLNDTIIPVGGESFLDADVTPAVPMYYKFTVVQTDMTESAFSNVASAAALDTIAPVITHVPETSAMPGFGLRLEAQVTDNVSVTGVAVHYRPTGGTGTYTQAAMINISGNEWAVTLPGSAVQSPGVDYYITATDGISQVYHGTPVAPHTVVVSDTPTLTSISPNQGPVEGGTAVILSGTLFQPGASVLFDGVPASDVVVQTANQIHCTTPPHVPFVVDVTVVNPDSTQATLLSGFHYVDEDVVLSLPTLSDDYGAIVDIPLSVSNADGLLAATVTIQFDPGVLSLQDVQTGAMTYGWYLSEDTPSAGVVTIALANATPVSGNGDLARLTFEVVGAPNSQTVLTIVNAELNEGGATADWSNGLFTVNGWFTLSGNVGYYNGGGSVPDATLSLVGVGQKEETSDASGNFTLSDIQTGSYVLTPVKTDDAREITAMDASLVLQSAAGTLTLSGNQFLAADVNRSGVPTSLDASFILQHSVGLRALPFPGSGRIWDFEPQQRSYASIDGDLTGQNFTAVLIGDVTGNWTAEVPEPPPIAPPPPEEVHLTLPQVASRTGGQITLPLEIELDGASVYAANLTIVYDPEELAIGDVAPGAAADGLAYALNTGEPGVIRVGLAGATAWNQDGTLLELPFEVIGDLDEPARVSIAEVSLNEGTVLASLQAGLVVGYAEVVDRRVFYNQAGFTDEMVAIDKTALLPGQTATLANYTGYSEGINGVAIEVLRPTDPDGISATDFQFHVGNDNDTTNWNEAPPPAGVTTTPIAGDDDLYRIVITWPDRAIVNQWLQVTVSADTAVGLETEDVFYFGNFVGDVGDDASPGFVTAVDLVAIRNHPRGPSNPAGMENRYDINKDSLVNATDLILARNAVTSPLDALRMIAPPSPSPAPVPVVPDISGEPVDGLEGKEISAGHLSCAEYPLLVDLLLCQPSLSYE